MRTALLLILGTLVGCGSSAPSPELSLHRQKFLLSAEPAGALGVLDARESVSAGSEVTLVGQIGGQAEPWAAGKASFVIADPSVLAEHAEEHCDDGCPFCAKKGGHDAALAVIQFIDGGEQVLSIDARELFGLADRETVVIRGRVQHNDPEGLMVVSAQGIYIRR